MNEKENTSLDSTQFGKFLISSYARILAGQHLQVKLIIDILSRGDMVKRVELEQQYRIDFEKKSSELYNQMVKELNG